MITSIAILIFSMALFFFYVHTLCEQVLRREFSRAYFQDVLNSLDLEFPRVHQAVMAGAPMNHSQMRIALKCDYMTLKYLVRNGSPQHHRFSWNEKLITVYFRFLLFMLPLRYALHFRERQAAMKLTVILRYLTNLVGQRLVLSADQAAAPSPQA